MTWSIGPVWMSQPCSWKPCSSVRVFTPCAHEGDLIGYASLSGALLILHIVMCTILSSKPVVAQKGSKRITSMVISTLFLTLGALHVAARLLSPAPEVLQDENFSELAAWPDAWGVVNKVVWVSQCIIFTTILVCVCAENSLIYPPF